MKQEIFTFNGVEYYSVNAVRTAISKQTKVCFGVPQTAKEWKKLGVTYTIKEIPDPVPTEPTEEEIRQRELEEAKRVREDAVAAIKVTVDEMEFDGDETAQGRMSRTITAALNTGETMDSKTYWVLANNEVAQVTIGQLSRALRAAGEEQTRLWTVPYTTTKE